MKQTLKKQDQRTRLERCVDHIVKLGRRMEPYFAIVDIFVQTNPQYAGLFWGSLRLLFKVGAPHSCRHNSFFSLLLIIDSLPVKLELHRLHGEIQ